METLTLLFAKSNVLLNLDRYLNNITVTMSLIPGFKYDIFISYAHNDNKTVNGWVGKFVSTLRDALGQHTGENEGLRIWYDSSKIAGNTTFNSKIEKGIRDSAILICFDSPSYLRSDYCKKEREVFGEKAQKDFVGGLHVDDNLRIIHILLNNIPINKWPPEFEPTEGFKAFYNVSEENKLGDPLPFANPKFDEVALSVRNAVVKLADSINAIPRPEIEQDDEDRRDGGKVVEENINAALSNPPLSRIKIALICTAIAFLLIAGWYWLKPTNTKTIPPGNGYPDTAALHRQFALLHSFKDSSMTTISKTINNVNGHYFAESAEVYQNNNPYEPEKYLLDLTSIDITNLRIDSCHYYADGKIKQLYITNPTP